ncbi:MAG: hypothetical protein ABI351_12365 [Herbaspirillum sp.]
MNQNSIIGLHQRSDAYATVDDAMSRTIGDTTMRLLSHTKPTMALLVTRANSTSVPTSHRLRF